MIFLPFAIADMYLNMIFAVQDLCIETMFKQIPSGSFR